MKKMTCKDMGGSCDTEISANTAKEMMMKGEEHLNKNHPEVTSQMKSMSPEERKKWEDEFMDKWNNTPDMK